MQAEQVRRFKWESVLGIVILAAITVYYFSHQDEGLKTEKAEKAIEQIDTLSAIADTISFDIDTLKNMAGQQDVQSRRNAAQMEKVIDYIEKSDRAAAREIERAADTVKGKRDTL
jgi:hypothetical protein